MVSYWCVPAERGLYQIIITQGHGCNFIGFRTDYHCQLHPSGNFFSHIRQSTAGSAIETENLCYHSRISCHRINNLVASICFEHPVCGNRISIWNLSDHSFRFQSDYLPNKFQKFRKNCGFNWPGIDRLWSDWSSSRWNSLRTVDLTHCRKLDLNEIQTLTIIDSLILIDCDMSPVDIEKLIVLDNLKYLVIGLNGQINEGHIQNIQNRMTNCKVVGQG